MDFNSKSSFPKAPDISLNEALSRARLFIMGTSILIIMLFHNSFQCMSVFGYPIGLYGHWCVDIFIFVSGWGIFNSLDKHNRLDIKNFYLRRLIRILPASIICGACLFIFKKTGLLGLCGLNLWYIRTILLLYLISPIIYLLFVRYSPVIVLSCLIILSIIAVFIAVPCLKNQSLTIQSTISWTIARLPSFAIGMYIARTNYKIKKLISVPNIIIFLTILCIALQLHYWRSVNNSFSSYLHLLPYTLVGLIIPFICIALFFIYSKAPNIILNIAIFLGTYSLELYLIHEAIFREISLLQLSNYSKFILAYSFSIILAILLHIIVNKFKLKKCYKNQMQL